MGNYILIVYSFLTVFSSSVRNRANKKVDRFMDGWLKNLAGSWQPSSYFCFSCIGWGETPGERDFLKNIASCSNTPLQCEDRGSWCNKRDWLLFPLPLWLSLELDRMWRRTQIFLGWISSSARPFFRISFLFHSFVFAFFLSFFLPMANLSRSHLNEAVGSKLNRWSTTAEVEPRRMGHRCKRDEWI